MSRPGVQARVRAPFSFSYAPKPILTLQELESPPPWQPKVRPRRQPPRWGPHGAGVPPRAGFDEATLTFPRACFEPVSADPGCREPQGGRPIDRLCPLTAEQALLVWRKRLAPFTARHMTEWHAYPWGMDKEGRSIAGLPPEQMNDSLLPGSPASATLALTAEEALAVWNHLSAYVVWDLDPEAPYGRRADGSLINLAGQPRAVVRMLRLGNRAWSHLAPRAEPDCWPPGHPNRRDPVPAWRQPSQDVEPGMDGGVGTDVDVGADGGESTGVRARTGGVPKVPTTPCSAPPHIQNTAQIVENNTADQHPGRVGAHCHAPSCDAPNPNAPQPRPSPIHPAGAVSPSPIVVQTGVKDYRCAGTWLTGFVVNPLLRSTWRMTWWQNRSSIMPS